MAKELESAGEMAATDLGGGFSSLKEIVYNFLSNFFGWLSTHQSLALIIILIILAIIIWLILRVRKIRKQLAEEVSTKNIEIGKKEALIKEQNDKLEVLQKKMSDQQGFISEALLRTITNITGYDIDQLPVFFKSLSKISGNPLQMADTQMNSLTADQRFEKDRHDSIEENAESEKIAQDTDSGGLAEADKSGEK